MEDVIPPVHEPFQIEGYYTFNKMLGPGALVLLGGVFAAVHAPQAWNGRNVRALASVAMGLGVAIVAIVSAAREWNRAQQLGESAISHIGQLKTQLGQANENQKKESATLKQELSELQEGFATQTTTIEDLTGELKNNEAILTKTTKLKQEFEGKFDAVCAASDRLNDNNITLHQQLKKLQKKFDGQATTTEKLTGELKRNKDYLSKETRFAKKLGEEHENLRVVKESLGTYSTELERQLAEARGLGTGIKHPKGSPQNRRDLPH